MILEIIKMIGLDLKIFIINFENFNYIKFKMLKNEVEMFKKKWIKNVKQDELKMLKKKITVFDGI